jgi:hypothetical protein
LFDATVAGILRHWPSLAFGGIMLRDARTRYGKSGLPDLPM